MFFERKTERIAVSVNKTVVFQPEIIWNFSDLGQVVVSVSKFVEEMVIHQLLLMLLHQVKPKSKRKRLWFIIYESPDMVLLIKIYRWRCICLWTFNWWWSVINEWNDCCDIIPRSNCWGWFSIFLETCPHLIRWSSRPIKRRLSKWKPF